MRWLDKVENTFISLSILMTVLILTASIMFRMFGSGFSWANESVRYLFIWITFIGSSVCIRENQHIGITLLPDLLKGVPKKILLLFFHLVMFVFSIYILFWLGVKLVIFNYDTFQTAPSLRIPLFIVYLCLPIGGGLMTIRSIQDIIPAIKELVNKNRMDTEV